MRVLWICNFEPAYLAALRGQRAQNKEGWVTGAMDRLLAGQDVELAVAFPVKQEEEPLGEVGGVRYYGFYEDTDAPEDYDPSLEGALGHICEEYAPDVIHCYGTEYPHTLAVLKLPEWRGRVLIHVQGVMQRCAEAYDGGLPAEVTERATLRDVLRKDSIWQQKLKYELRAGHEQDALRLAQHVCGRTAFDKEYVESVQPEASYYSMNETLRPCFYRKAQEAWQPHPGQHRIVMSQGNIPLKGAHDMIEALAIVRKTYPDATLAVAGDDILRGMRALERIRISGYGKYLREKIAALDLDDAVSYIGQRSAEEMVSVYLDADVYVLASWVENSPNSLGEAMILGLPCVTARVGGIPSLAEETEVRYFERGDAQALAEQILWVFADSQRAAALGEAARRRALLTHDPEANGRMLRWIYDSVARESAT